MANLSTSEIATRLAPFWQDLSEDHLQQLQKYLELLLFWNQKISLTSLTDPYEIVARHFGESVFAGKVLPFRSGRLADVGTGAGFPGIPLKIVFPGLEVTLVEPNFKKCAFLSEVIATLGLQGIRISRSQFSEIRPEAGNFDFITSRALGDYKNLLRWTHSALAPSGLVALWVGLEDSMQTNKSPNWTWMPPRQIPESDRRFILVGYPNH